MVLHRSAVWAFVLISMAESVYSQGTTAARTTTQGTTREQSTSSSSGVSTMELILIAAVGAVGGSILIMAVLVVVVATIYGRKKPAPAQASTNDDTGHAGHTEHVDVTPGSTRTSCPSPVNPPVAAPATPGVPPITRSSRSRSMYVLAQPWVQRSAKSSSQYGGHKRHGTKSAMFPTSDPSTREAEKRERYLRESGYISHADIQTYDADL